MTDHLVIRAFPGASEGDADAYIDPAFFGELHRASSVELVRTLIGRGLGYALLGQKLQSSVTVEGRELQALQAVQAREISRR